ncbi:MAG: HD domain-containing protein [ANME-2 cluster archaeon]|nr:HD domain-containing protein [ANME-2 cluster archaeon]MBC2745740.1 HD domain-containing protein [ANME-2 cluster archaeon]
MKNNAPNHVVIAGLLHDVVEDGDYTLSDIRDEFGDEVAALVDGGFEPEELINAKGGKSKIWPERKAHTIDFIKNADRDMNLLSCADKLANIRDIIRDYNRLGDGVWGIFNALKESVAWYYISMLDAFGNGDEGISDTPAFKEFEKYVGEMFGYVKV